MDIQYNISENTEERFSICYDINEDINDLRNEIAKLEARLQGKKQELSQQFATLLCLCAVNSKVYGCSNHKVPLIKTHRQAYGSGLKEAKEIVEKHLALGELV